MKSAKGEQKVVASNRKAFHDYHILDSYECGMVLVGTEVKSLRTGSCSLREAYARIDGGEMWLYDVHIPPYVQAAFGNHEATRKRKLLLHRHELDRIAGKIKEKGLTLVPTKLYFLDGRAKVEIALVKGKAAHDKRSSIQERDMKREIDRSLRARQKGI